MTPREQAEVAIQEIREHLANCRQSPVDANLILADRRDFADRIDRIEKVMQNILSEYETVTEQRGEMERAARREGEQIIHSAESRADDVYAASIVYTDNMIGTLQTIIDDTNDSLNGVIRRFRKEMRRQKDQLKKNETELQAELINLKESRKYLQMIEEINEAREEKRLAAKRLAGEEPAGAGDDSGREKSAGAAQKPAAGSLSSGGEKADVLINQDAAYFKWKEAQEGARQEPAEAPQAQETSEDPQAALQEQEASEDPQAAPQEQDAPEAAQAREPDDRTRFAGIEEQETWQMERKEDGRVDPGHTRVFRPVSREQVYLDRESTPKIDTARLPDEDTLMRAMLQGEENDLIDDADHFEYYDDDLGDLEELDDFDDFDDFGDDEYPYDEDDSEPGAVGRQVAGRIKDFLLGK